MTVPGNTIEALVRPGATFDGKYRVVRELGRGGMGAVMEAEHLGLGSRVAVKVMLPSLAHDAALVERFLREARSTARISSDHVARVLDVESLSDGTPYLVMELLNGENMGTYIDRGAATDAESYLLLLQVCDGLAHAHAAGLVHRDLKPENVFIVRRRSGEPCAKILDFGIAKDVAQGTSMTQTSEAFGSPSYMSPEQIKSSRSVDARSDVWALGVVAFELFSKNLPFPGRTVFEVGARVIGEPPLSLASLRPDLPAPVVAAVMGCLEKSPERRTPDVARFAEAIAPFVPGGPGFVVGIREALTSPRPSPARGPLPPPEAESMARAATPEQDTQLTVTTGRDHALGGKRGAAVALASLGLAVLIFGLALRERLRPQHAPANPPVTFATAASKASDEPKLSPLAPSTASAPALATPSSPGSTASVAVPAAPPSATASASQRPKPAGTPVPHASSTTAPANPPASSTSTPKHYDRHGE
ncbi:MAG: protein kinase [Polyangiaceae bacterium]